MDYKTFEKKLSKIAKAHDLEIKIWHDTRFGVHVAKFSDGTHVTGNSYSNKLTWKFGSGHCMMSAI